MHNLETELRGFIGGGDQYQHWSGMRYTEGVRYLAENGKAYWLLDAIASWQPRCMKDAMLRGIQFWTLTVSTDKSAKLRCDRDSGNTAFKQIIEYTDFPLEEVRVWVSDGVLMLPNEY